LYIGKVINFLKFIFHISVLFLIVISLYPGSILGYILYGDLELQPNLIDNSFGTTINHFIYYFYLTLLGLYVYLRNDNFKKIFYFLIFLSIMLEMLQYIVPNRAFQLYDLIANIAGVLVGYFLVKIYLFFSKT
tara:strand:+ start:130 stop:528 length:399 start_codon:yes stop_codon:yes gene_type:complete